MCWDYVECCICHSTTQCTASCYCDDDESCYDAGHRDCKSFQNCSECGKDICEDCYLITGICDSCESERKNKTKENNNNSDDESN